jgi:hypothetical protein
MQIAGLGVDQSVSNEGMVPPVPCSRLIIAQETTK